MTRETVQTLAFCAIWFLAGWLYAAVEDCLTRPSACEIAAAAPTDWNIEACTGAPIDLASE
jgi:hypothetical protein